MVLKLSSEQGAARGAKRGRERRLFNVSAHQPEVREAGDGSGSLTLEGYACVTETPYTMRDWLGEYEEVVRQGAFTKTLADNDDVRLLLNHDGLPMARTKSGTLELDEDDTGLHVVAKLDAGSGLVNDVRSAMARGDLDEMSFAFEVIRQQWSPDWLQRDILEVRLFDVAVVTYPANPATSASVRGFDDIDALDDDAARAALGRLQARFAVADPETQQQHPLSLYVAEAQRLDFV